MDAMNYVLGRASTNTADKAAAHLFGNTITQGAALKASYSRPVDIIEGPEVNRIEALASTSAFPSLLRSGPMKQEMSDMQIGDTDKVVVPKGGGVYNGVSLNAGTYLLSYPSKKPIKFKDGNATGPEISHAYNGVQLAQDRKLGTFGADEFYWKLYRSPTFIKWFGDWRKGHQGIDGEVEEPGVMHPRNEVTNEPLIVLHFSGRGTANRRPFGGDITDSPIGWSEFEKPLASVSGKENDDLSPVSSISSSGAGGLDTQTGAVYGITLNGHLGSIAYWADKKGTYAHALHEIHSALRAKHLGEYIEAMAESVLHNEIRLGVMWDQEQHNNEEATHPFWSRSFIYETRDVDESRRIPVSPNVFTARPDGTERAGPGSIYSSGVLTQKNNPPLSIRNRISGTIHFIPKRVWIGRKFSKQGKAIEIPSVGMELGGDGEGVILHYTKAGIKAYVAPSFSEGLLYEEAQDDDVGHRVADPAGGILPSYYKLPASITSANLERLNLVELNLSSVEPALRKYGEEYKKKLADVRLHTFGSGPVSQSEYARIDTIEAGGPDLFEDKGSIVPLFPGIRNPLRLSPDLQASIDYHGNLLRAIIESLHGNFTPGWTSVSTTHPEAPLHKSNDGYAVMMENVAAYWGITKGRSPAGTEGSDSPYATLAGAPVTALSSFISTTTGQRNTSPGTIKTPLGPISQLSDGLNNFTGPLNLDLLPEDWIHDSGERKPLEYDSLLEEYVEGNQIEDGPTLPSGEALAPIFAMLSDIIHRTHHQKNKPIVKDEAEMPGYIYEKIITDAINYGLPAKDIRVIESLLRLLDVASLGYSSARQALTSHQRRGDGTSGYLPTKGMILWHPPFAWSDAKALDTGMPGSYLIYSETPTENTTSQFEAELQSESLYSGVSATGLVEMIEGFAKAHETLSKVYKAGGFSGVSQPSLTKTGKRLDPGIAARAYSSLELLPEWMRISAATVSARTPLPTNLGSNAPVLSKGDHVFAHGDQIYKIVITPIERARLQVAGSIALNLSGIVNPPANLIHLPDGTAGVVTPISLAVEKKGSPAPNAMKWAKAAEWLGIDINKGSIRNYGVVWKHAHSGVNISMFEGDTTLRSGVGVTDYAPDMIEADVSQLALLRQIKQVHLGKAFEDAGLDTGGISVGRKLSDARVVAQGWSAGKNKQGVPINQYFRDMMGHGYVFRSSLLQGRYGPAYRSFDSHPVEDRHNLALALSNNYNTWTRGEGTRLLEDTLGGDANPARQDLRNLSDEEIEAWVQEHPYFEHKLEGTVVFSNTVHAIENLYAQLGKLLEARADDDPLIPGIRVAVDLPSIPYFEVMSGFPNLTAFHDRDFQVPTLEDSMEEEAVFVNQFRQHMHPASQRATVDEIIKGAREKTKPDSSLQGIIEHGDATGWSFDPRDTLNVILLSMDEDNALIMLPPYRSEITRHYEPDGMREDYGNGAILVIPSSYVSVTESTISDMSENTVALRKEFPEISYEIKETRESKGVEQAEVLKEVSKGREGGDQKIVNIKGERKFSKLASRSSPAEALSGVIGSYLTSGLVPSSYISTVEGLSNGDYGRIVQDNIKGFKSLYDLDPNFWTSGYNKRSTQPDEQFQRNLEQVFVHMLSDYIVNNRDSHADNMGYSADGKVHAIDKGQGFKYNAANNKRRPPTYTDFQEGARLPWDAGIDEQVRNPAEPLGQWATSQWVGLVGSEEVRSVYNVLHEYLAGAELKGDAILKAVARVKNLIIYLEAHPDSPILFGDMEKAAGATTDPQYVKEMSAEIVARAKVVVNTWQDYLQKRGATIPEASIQPSQPSFVPTTALTGTPVTVEELIKSRDEVFGTVKSPMLDAIDAMAEGYKPGTSEPLGNQSTIVNALRDTMNTFGRGMNDLGNPHKYDGIIIESMSDAGVGQQVISLGYPKHLLSEGFDKGSFQIRRRIDDALQGNPEGQLNAFDGQQAASNRAILDVLKEAFGEAQRKGYKGNIQQFSKLTLKFDPQDNIAQVAARNPAAAEQTIESFDGNAANTDRTLQLTAQLHSKAQYRMDQTVATAERDNERIDRNIESTAERLQTLTGKYLDADIHEVEAQEAIKEIITDYMVSVDGQVDLSNLQGRLIGSIREVEQILKGDDLETIYRPVLEQILDGKIPVFDYIQSMASLGLDYAVAEESVISTAINLSEDPNMQAL